MLRSRITGAVAGAAVLASLVHAVPAAEAKKPRYPWGTVTSANHVLKRGCHDYTLQYKVNAPTNEWAAEIIVINPNGRRLASYAIDKDSDPAVGRLTLDLCRASTVYGKHRLEMKVTWQRGRELRDGWVKATFFRFTRSSG
ncbi:hypothetical protein [Nocardioides sp. R-C-SC26]|uniref:hypothetical protein n=1 Tax=Nocardioides sp. R-C-SC26 TaxID=2870414 RepID=UPI001E65404F|nr:hypothetical protein [Nocardioides sp. R-C-SC26]